MVLGKKVTILIGNGAEILPLEMGRKGPDRTCVQDAVGGVLFSLKSILKS